MNNRLQINPLIEENMNQMVDGELAINQLNGHITTKNGDKYISKTKKINIEIIDKKDFKEDLQVKINKDQELLDFYKQENTNIENTNKEIQNSLNQMLDKIIIYENKCQTYEDKLRFIDADLYSKLHKSEVQINTEINNNINLLGPMMIEFELLDRISDSNIYFNNYVKNHFNYPDKNDVIKNYGTVAQHEENKIEMDKKVYKSDYDSFISYIKSLYNEKGASYTISGGI